MEIYAQTGLSRGVLTPTVKAPKEPIHAAPVVVIALRQDMTIRTQNPAVVIPWGFDSPSRHSLTINDLYECFTETLAMTVKWRV